MMSISGCSLPAGGGSTSAEQVESRNDVIAPVHADPESHPILLVFAGNDRRFETVAEVESANCDTNVHGMIRSNVRSRGLSFRD